MLIRLMLLIVTICFFASLARSDEPVLVRSGVDYSTRPEARKRGGTILTIIGIAHLVIGGAVLGEMAATTGACKRTSGCMNEMGGLPQIVSGSLLVSSGAVLAAAGIPLWVSGARAASLNAGGVRVAF